MRCREPETVPEKRWRDCANVFGAVPRISGEVLFGRADPRARGEPAATARLQNWRFGSATRAADYRGKQKPVPQHLVIVFVVSPRVLVLEQYPKGDRVHRARLLITGAAPTCGSVRWYMAWAGKWSRVWGRPNAAASRPPTRSAAPSGLDRRALAAATRSAFTGG